MCLNSALHKFSYLNNMPDGAQKGMKQFMRIYGKDMVWPDNFLSRFFWTTDIGDIKSRIEFNASGLGLAMKSLTEEERDAFKYYFKEGLSFYDISIIRMPYYSRHEVLGLVDSAIKKLHHPKNITRFIKFK